MKRNREKLVDPYIGKDGRKKVLLSGIEKDLAYLVAITFQDICGKPIEGKLPSFKNGDPNDCSAENLYWK